VRHVPASQVAEQQSPFHVQAAPFEEQVGGGVCVVQDHVFVSTA
jgi:hypothetical protein